MPTLFEQKAPGIARKLMADLGLTAEQACGILGNLGHESAGFTAMQELRPVAGKGGYGWAQWTGPRRRSFEQWCKANKLSVNSDEGNYRYLVYELQTTEAAALKALKQAHTIEDCTVTFERTFERAGVKADASRIKYAKRALAALGDVPQAPVPTPKPTPVPPPPDVEPTPKKRERDPFSPKALWRKTWKWIAGGGMAGIGAWDYRVVIVIVVAGLVAFAIYRISQRGK